MLFIRRQRNKVF